MLIAHGVIDEHKCRLLSRARVDELGFAAWKFYPDVHLFLSFLLVPQLKNRT
jgi:hypothetical protein